MATAAARTAKQTTTPASETEELATSDREDGRLLDARQMAAELGVPERFIRDLITRLSSRIPDVKLGKLLRNARPRQSSIQLN